LPTGWVGEAVGRVLKKHTSRCRHIQSRGLRPRIFFLKIQLPRYLSFKTWAAAAARAPCFIWGLALADAILHDRIVNL
jgi:hypothetical protein